MTGHALSRPFRIARIFTPPASAAKTSPWIDCASVISSGCVLPAGRRREPLDHEHSRPRARASASRSFHWNSSRSLLRELEAENLPVALERAVEVAGDERALRLGDEAVEGHALAARRGRRRRRHDSARAARA